VLLELGKTAANQLVVLDLFYETECHVDDAIAWLDTNDKPRGTIYCDHHPEDLQKFKRHGYPAENAQKSHDDGIPELRRRLKPDGTAPIRPTPATPKAGTRRGTPQKLRERRQESENWTNESGRTRRKPPQSPTPPSADVDGADDADGRVGLLVAGGCTPLIREFHSYKESHVGASNADSDCLDALHYAVMGTTIT
jgi:hypothetical protein